MQAVGTRDASDAVGPAVYRDLAAEELAAQRPRPREVGGPADRRPGLRVDPPSPSAGTRLRTRTRRSARLPACTTSPLAATSPPRASIHPRALSPRQPGPPVRGGRSRRRAREPRAARRHPDRRTQSPWPRARRCAATASRLLRAPATSYPLAAPRTRGRTARCRTPRRRARCAPAATPRRATIPCTRCRSARSNRAPGTRARRRNTGVRHRAPPCPRARPRSARRRRARRAPSAGRRRRRGSRGRNECADARQSRSTTPARVRHRRVRPRACTAHGSPRPATRGHRVRRRSVSSDARRPLARGRRQSSGTSSECTSA